MKTHDPATRAMWRTFTSFVIVGVAVLAALLIGLVIASQMN